MTVREQAADVFASAGAACEELDVLPEAVEQLNLRLGGRVRIILTGGFYCEGFPDRAGLCKSCGRSLIEASHKPGCWPFDFLARLVVRTARMSRSHWAVLRGRS